MSDERKPEEGEVTEALQDAEPSTLHVPCGESVEHDRLISSDRNSGANEIHSDDKAQRSKSGHTDTPINACRAGNKVVQSSPSDSNWASAGKGARKENGSMRKGRVALKHPAPTREKASNACRQRKPRGSRSKRKEKNAVASSGAKEKTECPSESGVGAPVLSAAIDDIIREKRKMIEDLDNKMELMRRLKAVKDEFLAPFEQVLPKIKEIYDARVKETDLDPRKPWERYMSDVRSVMRYLKVSSREDFAELTLDDAAVKGVEDLVKTSICTFWQFLHKPEQYPDVGTPMDSRWIQKLTDFASKREDPSSSCILDLNLLSYVSGTLCLGRQMKTGRRQKPSLMLTAGRDSERQEASIYKAATRCRKRVSPDDGDILPDSHWSEPNVLKSESCVIKVVDPNSSNKPALKKGRFSPIFQNRATDKALLGREALSSPETGALVIDERLNWSEQISVSKESNDGTHHLSEGISSETQKNKLPSACGGPSILLFPETNYAGSSLSPFWSALPEIPAVALGQGPSSQMLESCPPMFREAVGNYPLGDAHADCETREFNVGVMQAEMGHIIDRILSNIEICSQNVQGDLKRIDAHGFRAGCVPQCRVGPSDHTIRKDATALSNESPCSSSDDLSAIREECQGTKKKLSFMETTVRLELGDPVVSCSLHVKDIMIPDLILRANRGYPRNGVRYGFDPPPLGWHPLLAMMRERFRKRLALFAGRTAGFGVVLYEWGMAVTSVIQDLAPSVRGLEARLR